MIKSPWNDTPERPSESLYIFLLSDAQFYQCLLSLLYSVSHFHVYFSSLSNVQYWWCPLSALYCFISDRKCSCVVFSLSVMVQTQVLSSESHFHHHWQQCSGSSCDVLQVELCELLSGLPLSFTDHVESCGNSSTPGGCVPLPPADRFSHRVLTAVLVPLLADQDPRVRSAAATACVRWVAGGNCHSLLRNFFYLKVFMRFFEFFFLFLR